MLAFQAEPYPRSWTWDSHMQTSASLLSTLHLPVKNSDTHSHPALVRQMILAYLGTYVAQGGILHVNFLSRCGTGSGANTPKTGEIRFQPLHMHQLKDLISESLTFLSPTEYIFSFR